jgi:hypothetical protein
LTGSSYGGVLWDYVGGYWDEFYLRRYPNVGYLGWFWENLNATWDDIVDRFPDALPVSENKDCNPSNLMS